MHFHLKKYVEKNLVKKKNHTWKGDKICKTQIICTVQQIYAGEMCMIRGFEWLQLTIKNDVCLKVLESNMIKYGTEK